MRLSAAAWRFTHHWARGCSSNVPNALYYELKSKGFIVGYNTPFNVTYKGNSVGEYFADITVNNKIIIELKSVKALSSAHIAQLINYLHISGCKLGLLVNFQGNQLEWRRIVI